MPKKQSYDAYLRQQIGSLIDQLQLPPLYQQSLKERWLDQMIWADKKADQCRRLHYRLRLTAIVGGVVLPALVGISVQLGQNSAFFRVWFPPLTFGLSQVIAVSVAVEEFCRFGDRWRDYRKLAEDLKSEGWQYLQSSGHYELIGSHEQAYTQFASRIESIIKDDVQSYITDLMQQQAKQEAEVQQILTQAQAVTNDKTLMGALNGQADSGTRAAVPVAPMPMGVTPGNGAPSLPTPLPLPTNTTSSDYRSSNPGSSSYSNGPITQQPALASPPAPSNTFSTGIATFTPLPATPAPPAPSPPPPMQPATTPPPAVANPVMPAPAARNLNAAILSAATNLKGMSTAEGPDGGNNACAWTVNRVLQRAGIPALGDNPNYVPELVKALKTGRGQLVTPQESKAGDLVIAYGEEHIGIAMEDGCQTVLSNSSSRACFVWESNVDFDGSYGGSSTVYRLIQ